MTACKITFSPVAVQRTTRSRKQRGCCKHDHVGNGGIVPCTLNPNRWKCFESKPALELSTMPASGLCNHAREYLDSCMIMNLVSSSAISHGPSCAVFFSHVGGTGPCLEAACAVLPVHGACSDCLLSARGWLVRVYSAWTARRFKNSAMLGMYSSLLGFDSGS